MECSQPRVPAFINLFPPPSASFVLSPDNMPPRPVHPTPRHELSKSTVSLAGPLSPALVIHSPVENGARSVSFSLLFRFELREVTVPIVFYFLRPHLVTGWVFSFEGWRTGSNDAEVLLSFGTEYFAVAGESCWFSVITLLAGVGSVIILELHLYSAGICG